MKHRNLRFRANFLLLVTSAICAYPVSSQNTAASSGETLTRILKENETKSPTDATITQIQEIIDKDPKNYYARLVMGNTLDRVGLPMQAIEQYQLAVQYGPNSAKSIIELVKAQISVGQKEAAMRLLQQANKRFPNDPEITFWIGNYYLAKGDVRNAEISFDKAQQAKIMFFGMATARADLKLRQGHFAQASLLVDADLAKNPTYPLGNAVKGVALFNQGKYKEAVPFLKIAYDQFALKEEYAKKYAESCLLAGDYKTALEPGMVAVAVACRQMSGALPETKWALANIVQRVPRSYVREQVPIITDKISKRIPNATMHFTFGDLFDTYGYHDLAVSQFYRSFQIDPSQSATAYRLANDLEMYFQKYDEAKGYLAKAHALSPKNVEIADRLERLQSRLPGRDADLAWQLKDLLRQQRSPI